MISTFHDTTIGREPRVARLLITIASPKTCRESLLGDLAEEFAMRLMKDASQARKWYWAQAFRSMYALLKLRAQHSRLAEGFLLAYVAVLLPILAVDRFWAFVLSGIPLKADWFRPVEFFAVLLTLCTISCIAVFHATRARGSALAFMVLFLPMIPYVCISWVPPAFQLALGGVVLFSYLISKSAGNDRPSALAS